MCQPRVASPSIWQLEFATLIRPSSLLYQRGSKVCKKPVMLLNNLLNQLPHCNAHVNVNPYGPQADPRNSDREGVCCQNSHPAFSFHCLGGRGAALTLTHSITLLLIQNGFNKKLRCSQESFLNVLLLSCVSRHIGGVLCSPCTRVFF